MIRKLSFVAFIVLLFLTVACAPQSPPAPQPVPTPKQATPSAAPTSNLPSQTSQDAAWAKVMEAGRKEGRVTVYTVHIFADMAIEMARAFAERTGIRLETVSTGTSASAIERIKAERRAGLQIASVMTGAGTFVLIAKQDGLTEKMGDIPEIRDESIYRYAPHLDKDGHMLSQQLNTISPWVNTKLVQTSTEPKSWLDLLKPEWKAKIGVSNPDAAPSPNYTFYGLTSRGKLDQSYFTELAKQELQFHPTARLGVEALARGQVSLAFSDALAANSTAPFLSEGAPIKPIDMKEGIAVYRSGAVALLQGAPHPNAARVFINWLFSKEGASIFGKHSATLGFRKDVPSYIPPAGQLTPANPIMTTLEDELEIAKIQRERTLTKILRGG